MSETLVSTQKAPMRTHHRASSTEVISQAEIDAGQTHQIFLGLYENSFPEPEIHIDVQPKSARVQVLPIRTHHNGDYILSYAFKNVWDQACHIVVRLQSA